MQIALTELINDKLDDLRIVLGALLFGSSNDIQRVAIELGKKGSQPRRTART